MLLSHLITMRHLLILLIVSLGRLGQGLRSSNRYHDPRRSLVLFLDSNGTIPSSENYKCGGAFVTRQHVLTTLQCALWSKRHQLRPWRLHYFGTSMSSTEVVSGNSPFSITPLKNTQKVSFCNITTYEQLLNLYM